MSTTSRPSTDETPFSFYVMMGLMVVAFIGLVGFLLFSL